MGFSGGKVAAGERPEAALIRELDEELGIRVDEACLAPLTFASHAYPDFHLLMPLYVCRRWEGFVQAREGQALKWVRARICAPIRCRPPTRPRSAARGVAGLMRASGKVTDLFPLLSRKRFKSG